MLRPIRERELRSVGGSPRRLGATAVDAPIASPLPRIASAAARLPRVPVSASDAGFVPLDFTAIDFETANSSSASACAVGLTRVRDGRVVATAGWLIKPPAGHDEFLDFHIGIHGIRPEHCADALGWSDQLTRLAAFAGADVLVAHNAGFDMAVLRRACEATGDVCPPYRYLCSVQVARKTYDLPSYRLPSVAAEAGFGEFDHHEATADSLACAHIMIDAARRLGASDIAMLAASAGVRIGRIPAGEPRDRPLSAVA